jgi:hypothetical protein
VLELCPRAFASTVDELVEYAYRIRRREHTVNMRISQPLQKRLEYTGLVQGCDRPLGVSCLLALDLMILKAVGILDAELDPKICSWWLHLYPLRSLPEHIEGDMGRPSILETRAVLFGCASR